MTRLKYTHLSYLVQQESDADSGKDLSEVESGVCR